MDGILCYDKELCLKYFTDLFISKTVVHYLEGIDEGDYIEIEFILTGYHSGKLTYRGVIYKNEEEVDRVSISCSENNIDKKKIS